MVKEIEFTIQDLEGFGIDLHFFTCCPHGIGAPATVLGFIVFGILQEQGFVGIAGEVVCNAFVEYGEFCVAFHGFVLGEVSDHIKTRDGKTFFRIEIFGALIRLCIGVNADDCQEE